VGFARGFGFALLQLVLTVLNIYTWVVIIRALISWVSPDPYNPIVQILRRLTEPLLRPLRRLVPPHKLGGLDLSPLLLILLIQLVKYTLVYSFYGGAFR
jgi:YggT family protein